MDTQDRPVSRTEKTRRLIRDLDDMDFDVSNDLLEGLHDRIMSQIEKTEIEPPARVAKVRSHLKSHWRSWLYSGSTMGMLAAALTFGGVQVAQWLGPHEALANLDQVSQELVIEAAISPDDFSNTILTNVSTNDFFVDVALQSHENLSISEVNEILRTQ